MPRNIEATSLGVIPWISPPYGLVIGSKSVTGSRMTPRKETNKVNINFISSTSLGVKLSPDTKIGRGNGNHKGHPSFDFTFVLT